MFLGVTLLNRKWTNSPRWSSFAYYNVISFQWNYLTMFYLVTALFVLIFSTISSQGDSLRSPFDSGESISPYSSSSSSFLFPSSFVPRSTFVFPRSIFARRLSNIQGRNKLSNELLQLNKTCPKGFQPVRDNNEIDFKCECKKYHLQWPEDGLCYREYEQGPCPKGHR